MIHLCLLKQSVVGARNHSNSSVVYGGQAGGFQVENGPGFHSSPLGNYPISMVESQGVGGFHHNQHQAPVPIEYDPYTFPNQPNHGYHLNNSHAPYNHDFAMNPTGLENLSISPNAPFGPKMVSFISYISSINSI
jgi:hypothetical protein